MAERPRRRPASGARRWSTIERELRGSGAALIAGVDEVGRGSLAGPVVACAVVMPPDARAIAGVDDSKRLAPARREALAARIRSRALALALGAASPREIDRVNIYHATVIAMRRALCRLPVRPDHILVDGRPIRTLGFAHTAVVGGDARCYSIACASIVAKVTRDRLMRALARRYPAYGWERNVGYGTSVHWEAIESTGRCAHHRTSFLAARQLVLAFGDAALADEALPPEVVLDALAPVEELQGGELDLEMRSAEGPSGEGPGDDPAPRAPGDDASAPGE